MWKLSIVLLSVMRVIMPLISSNPFDLVSEEKSRQPWMYRHMLCVCSLGSAELVHATGWRRRVVENYCVEAIHCVIASHEGDNAIDQLKPIRPCVRREI